MFYNATLGIIAIFAVGAVRQFCAFAIVVLVAHWFLAHTFFMAVLSIDIARLEVNLYPTHLYVESTYAKGLHSLKSYCARTPAWHPQYHRLARSRKAQNNPARYGKS